MKWYALLSVVAVCALASDLFAQDDAKKSKLAEMLKTPRDKASYGIGRSIGEQLKSTGLDLDNKILLEAITEALSGVPSGQTQKDLQDSVAILEKEVQEANV